MSETSDAGAITRAVDPKPRTQLRSAGSIHTVRVMRPLPSGYGWNEYDSYGNSGASFSLGGDPGESVQNYLSSFVQY